MGDIYASACLVMVRACGADMESPLPGVKMGRPADQMQIVVSGLRLTNVLPKTTNFSYKSVWSSRGWRHQASVLATRKSIITPLAVVLDCNAQVNWEDDYGQNRLRKKEEYHFGDNMLFDGTPFEDFTRHLENCTSRNLSFPSVEDITTALVTTAPRPDGCHERAGTGWILFTQWDELVKKEGTVLLV